MKIVTKEIEDAIGAICHEFKTLTTKDLQAWIVLTFDVDLSAACLRHYLVKNNLPYKKMTYKYEGRSRLKMKNYVGDAIPRSAIRVKQLAKEANFMKGVDYATQTINSSD